MDNAVAVDMTDSTTTSTQPAHVSSDGKGHDKISVRAGAQASVNATMPRAPLSTLSPTPRDPSLPENFKTTADLAKSYREAQATLTRQAQELAVLKKSSSAGTAADVSTTAAVASPPVAVPAPALPDITGTPPTTTDSSPAVSAPIPTPEPRTKIDLRALSKEWAENGGKLTRRTMDKLEEVGITERTIAQYVEAQTAFADKYRSSLEVAAGGKDRLPILLQWASTNQPDASARYNQALASEDWQGAQLLLAGMSANYTMAAGRDPKLVISGAEAERAMEERPFLSQHEMVSAMNDHRYKNDPAYQRAVTRQAMGYAKLKREGKAF